MEEIQTTLVFLALCVPFLVATVWAVVDASQRDFGSAGRKATWWIVASVPFVGFIVYVAFGMRRGRKLQ